MIVTLDRLSSRYHVLPSYALEHATTFDLQVMDISIRHDNVIRQKEAGTYVPPVPKLSEEEMYQMIEAARKSNEHED